MLKTEKFEASEIYSTKEAQGVSVHMADTAVNHTGTDHCSFQNHQAAHHS